MSNKTVGNASFKLNFYALIGGFIYFEFAIVINSILSSDIFKMLKPLRK